MTYAPCSTDYGANCETPVGSYRSHPEAGGYVWSVTYRSTARLRPCPTGKNRMTPRTAVSIVPRSGVGLIEDVQAQINFGQTIREGRTRSPRTTGQSRS